MLVLGRRLGQAFLIGDDVEIRVLKVTDHHVRLGISAPDGVRILREELYQKLLALPDVTTAPRRADCEAVTGEPHLADGPEPAQDRPALRPQRHTSGRNR